MWPKSFCLKKKYRTTKKHEDLHDLPNNKSIGLLAATLIRFLEIICNGDPLTLTLTFDLSYDCFGQPMGIRQEQWWSGWGCQSDGGGHRRRVPRRGFERSCPRRMWAERHHPLRHRCKSLFHCSHGCNCIQWPHTLWCHSKRILLLHFFNVVSSFLQVLGYYNRNNINTKNLIKEIQSIASSPTENYFFNVSEEAALSTIAGTLGNRIFNIEGRNDFFTVFTIFNFKLF